MTTRRRRFDGSQVRALRQAMGLGLDEMAARIPISRRTLIRWEQGHTTRPVPAAVKAFTALRDQHERTTRGDHHGDHNAPDDSAAPPVRRRFL